MGEKRLRFPTETFLQLLNIFQPGTIRYPRRIFVNRNLRLEKVQVVGFDMDYTLAVYNQALDFLEWELALKRLVDKYDFPKKVSKFKYDPEFAIRGLVMDMAHGNVFKMDRHHHVSRGLHGTRPIPPERRNELYRKRLIRPSQPEFALVDTLFSLPETHMYAQTVDMLDAEGRGNAAEYRHAYMCIRKAVDGIHRDDTLKRVVMKDLAKYVVRDPDIAYSLERFIYSGKKLFLLTNSGWSYTNAMMSHLLDGVLDSFPKWTDYFDLIAVKAAKPTFFMKKKPLRPEELASGEIAYKVYRGGCLRSLEGVLGAGGDKVLYIGDHIYGDILKSKKTSTWRTAMIIPEMEQELEALDTVREDRAKLDRLFRRRHTLDIEMNYQQRLLMSLLNLQELAGGNGKDPIGPISEVSAVSERNVASIRESIDKVERRMEKTEFSILSKFNPNWGMLFKEGTAHSVFGAQVEDYACIYTSRLSNFLSYSPLHYFQTQRDRLAHERDE